MVLNYQLVLKTLAMIGIVLAAAMLPSVGVSVIYGEWHTALSFLTVIVPMAVAGFVVTKVLRPKSQVLKMREGFLVVGASWFLASLAGSLPFLISGAIPRFADAFFETASGFSTTGASILTEIEILPKGILFWRCFTHWLGGMGILVFAIALLPRLGISGQRIVRAETPGPTLDKLKPKISDSAQILYVMYGGMTIVETILLMLGGMDWFDALTHTFSTVGTGGFSNYGASIGHFDSLYIDLVIAVFMLMAGINFNLYYHLLKGQWKSFFADGELRFYLLIISGVTLIISAALYLSGMYHSIGQALRDAFFQTASIITTTGYATADFDFWPPLCKSLLFILMFIGGCSASTGGGIKVTRILVLVKLLKRGIYRRIHPQAVYPVKIDGRPVNADTVSGITSFVFLYLVVFFAASLVLSLENFDLLTTFSATVACLSNVGPGFSLVGPAMNFSIFSDFSKIFLSFLMIMGRLELFTILLLFSPTFWNPDR